MAVFILHAEMYLKLLLKKVLISSFPQDLEASSFIRSNIMKPCSKIFMYTAPRKKLLPSVRISTTFLPTVFNVFQVQTLF